jgi:hypothetical protein
MAGYFGHRSPDGAKRNPGSVDRLAESPRVSLRFTRAMVAAKHQTPSLRANGSRERAPDDRLREAIHSFFVLQHGLLRRFAPRNDVEACETPFETRLLQDTA